MTVAKQCYDSKRKFFFDSIGILIGSKVAAVARKEIQIWFNSGSKKSSCSCSS